MRYRQMTAMDHKLMMRNARSRMRMRQQRQAYLTKTKSSTEMEITHDENGRRVGSGNTLFSLFGISDF